VRGVAMKDAFAMTPVPPSPSLSVTGFDASGSATPSTSRLADCRRISIDGLTLQTSLGVYAFEKLNRRGVTIDAALWIPLALCTPQDDQLAEVVDYEEFYKLIIDIVGAGHVHLIESLVDRLADALMAHVAVRAVHVRVAKMAVFDNCRSISIDATRGFEDRAN
jgi:dihydroneopterin aldolase